MEKRERRLRGAGEREGVRDRGVGGVGAVCMGGRKKKPERVRSGLGFVLEIIQSRCYSE